MPTNADCLGNEPVYCERMIWSVSTTSGAYGFAVRKSLAFAFLQPAAVNARAAASRSWYVEKSALRESFTQPGMGSWQRSACGLDDGGSPCRPAESRFRLFAPRITAVLRRCRSSWSPC